MRPKLTLKDLTFKTKEVPVAPPKMTDPPSEIHGGPAVTNGSEHALPQALWVPLQANWLRVVVDNRLGLGRRIYRIEMYDKTREKRLAVFRRQTEAMRQ